MTLDVLLTGLEGQNETAPPFPVDGLADDSSRQITDVFFRGGDVAE